DCPFVGRCVCTTDDQAGHGGNHRQDLRGDAVVTAPSEYRQFGILYRDFLARIVDLELISPGGDFHKGLVQFGALLAAFNFVLAVHEVPRFALSHFGPRERVTAVASEIEFLIATTMAVTGLLMLLAWNSVLPDRRDCDILGALPVAGRVIFLARG